MFTTTGRSISAIVGRMKKDTDIRISTGIARWGFTKKRRMMSLNSATMFVASLMMDDDEFREAMNEWKEEIDKAMKEEEDTDENNLHVS